ISYFLYPNQANMAYPEQSLEENELYEEEEESFFQDIDLLQNHGINVADIKKLKTSGICTI
ncbi:Meiotic recombination protein DMC1/LIM15-like protein, partial [Stegodyphus mimosarum]